MKPPFPGNGADPQYAQHRQPLQVNGVLGRLPIHQFTHGTDSRSLHGAEALVQVALRQVAAHQPGPSFPPKTDEFLAAPTSSKLGP